MDIANILFRMRPGEEWILNGDSYEELVWISDTEKPSFKEIQNFENEAELMAAMDYLRERRDSLLIQSDWTQLIDAPVDKDAWASYRQQLRDLPETSDPFNPEWPEAPE